MSNFLQKGCHHERREGVGKGASKMAKGRRERGVDDHLLHDQGTTLRAALEHRRRERIHAHAARAEPSRSVGEKEGHAPAGEGHTKAQRPAHVGRHLRGGYCPEWRISMPVKDFDWEKK